MSDVDKRQRMPILQIGTVHKTITGWELSGWAFDACGGGLSIDVDSFMGWTPEELQQISEEYFALFVSQLGKDSE